VHFQALTRHLNEQQKLFVSAIHIFMDYLCTFSGYIRAGRIHLPRVNLLLTIMERCVCLSLSYAFALGVNNESQLFIQVPLERMGIHVWGRLRVRQLATSNIFIK
jgi:hypothetical protein